MLSALIKSSGERIFGLDFKNANEIRSKYPPDDIVCPHCGEVMVIRQAKILYFEHQKPCQTTLIHQPSRIPHLLCKMRVYQQVKKECDGLAVTIETEAAIEELNRIVDVLVTFPNGHRVAYDILMTPTKTGDIETRIAEATNAGIDLNLFLGGLANNDITREWFKQNYGNCFYIAFGTTTRTVSDGSDSAT